MTRILNSQEIRNRFVNSFPPAHYFRGKKNTYILNKSLSLGDDIITKVIESSKPQLIGRLGGTEARVLGCYMDTFHAKSIWDLSATLYSVISYPKRVRQLRELSGVYPSTPRILKRFVSEQIKALAEIDVLGCWGATFTWVEGIHQPTRGSEYVSHHLVSPWIEPFELSRYGSKPWSATLSGKKVLIISGFSDSFKKQYERINKVFPNTPYPKFKGVFIKAPISLGGIPDGKTWIDHLERMKREMESENFDVALISAGAYALPLAHHAKKLGKIGITCGGELQLFFGVIGKRWEKMDKVTKFQNEYWVRPSESERPANWREIEGGCYW